MRHHVNENRLAIGFTRRGNQDMAPVERFSSSSRNLGAGSQRKTCDDNDNRKDGGWRGGEAAQPPLTLCLFCASPFPFTVSPHLHPWGGTILQRRPTVTRPWQDGAGDWTQAGKMDAVACVLNHYLVSPVCECEVKNTGKPMLPPAGRAIKFRCRVRCGIEAIL